MRKVLFLLVITLSGLFTNCSKETPPETESEPIKSNDTLFLGFYSDDSVSCLGLIFRNASNGKLEVKKIRDLNWNANLDHVTYEISSKNYISQNYLGLTSTNVSTGEILFSNGNITSGRPQFVSGKLYSTTPDSLIELSISQGQRIGNITAQPVEFPAGSASEGNTIFLVDESLLWSYDLNTSVSKSYPLPPVNYRRGLERIGPGEFLSVITPTGTTKNILQKIKIVGNEVVTSTVVDFNTDRYSREYSTCYNQKDQSFFFSLGNEDEGDGLLVCYNLLSKTLKKDTINGQVSGIEIFK